ncbi:GNAT family N-acetyltransferase [Marinicella gelatinilytica]|uniref:GNAT family N-acetyltransferase n=1 Tax=Marinicella gelatinilytica TaxID=2996017 RepID=UPI002260A21F|nr:GNAT family N-acetyltransferase [Marinicella gelatinilytica]MCX7545501.1 GNAT family N-acetyltransferase [Marinicella gelatinilytica]
MTNKIEYRAARSKDAKDMITVQFKAVQSIPKDDYTKQILSAWSPKPNSERIQWLAAFIKNDNVRCFVATNKKSKVLGVAIYLIAEQCIRSLYVDPKHAGIGIGTRLLNRIERFANKKAVDKLHLKASINSISFYKSMGYKKIEEAKQLLSNGSSMDAVFMEKVIN